MKLFGICLRILVERSEAEDALQKAYLAVWRRAGSFDGARGSPMTWLITLTRNRAVDRLRARRRTVSAPIALADEIAADGPDAFELMAATQEERRLAACMDALAGGDAAFLRAAFLGGSSYAELAARSGMPLGTVKSRVRRALLKLRACLE